MGIFDDAFDSEKGRLKDQQAIDNAARLRSRDRLEKITAILDQSSERIGELGFKYSLVDDRIVILRKVVKTSGFISPMNVLNPEVACITFSERGGYRLIKYAGGEDEISLGEGDLGKLLAKYLAQVS